MSYQSDIAQLYRDIYLEYYERTYDLGIREFVSPEGFWDNIFLPSVERVYKVRMGAHVIAKIDAYHQLVVSFNNDHLHMGITPIVEDPERSLSTCQPSEPDNSTP